MSKLDISTGSSTQNYRFEGHNVEQLMQIINNLQLQLGYHEIALKKAQKMINLLQNQNKTLNKQNQKLLTRCQQLQMKVVKYQNQINKNNFKVLSQKSIEMTSPNKRKRMTLKPCQNVNIENNQIYLNPQCYRSNMNIVVQPETPLRNHGLSGIKQKRSKFDTVDSITIQQTLSNAQTRTQGRKQKRSTHTPLKNSTQTLSFIPFDQLQVRTQWN